MAIPFLNNLDISNNQLLNAKLQITGTAPNAAAGQIYFDSTVGDETAKYYSNVTDTWVSLKEYTFPASSFITGAVTGTTPKPIITFDLSATACAVKFLVSLLLDSVPIHASWSFTSRSLGYELILAMFYTAIIL